MAKLRVRRRPAVDERSAIVGGKIRGIFDILDDDLPLLFVLSSNFS